MIFYNFTFRWKCGRSPLEPSHRVLYLSKSLNHILYQIKISVVRGTLTSVVEQLKEFGSSFTELVNLLLTDIVVESIHTLFSSRSVQDALVLVSRLGLQGNHICRIFAREGGMSVLLDLLGSTRGLQHRGMVLRALGTLCCVKEGILHFQEQGGMERIAEVLREDTEERIRMEAAGVLAQVTSPWIDNCLDPCQVDQHGYDLVSSLNAMCSSTKSCETFLLCTAALANLSYLSPLLLTAISQLDTLTPLLSFISSRVTPSIYILDQVATLLANLSANQHTRESLLDQEVVPALLLLLAADPGPGDRSPPVLAATQRVQQKAAIAIGRLSVHKDVCLSVLSAGGLDRLVELSVSREARLDSDYTLVSVVTAVRKLSQTVDIVKEIQTLGAHDILDSNILHSMQVYSPMLESFV